MGTAHKKLCAHFLALLGALAVLGGCAQAVEAPQKGEEADSLSDNTSIASASSAPSFADPIAERIAQMSLRQKVGQLFLIRPDSLDPSLTQAQINDANATGVQELTDAMRETLRQYPVGGVVIFQKNIADPQQLPAFLAELQAASELPLFAGVDEEGGSVVRIANAPAFDVPQYESAQAVGDSGNPDAARGMGAVLGGYLLQYGLNLDFAPDADVNTNPDNPVIGTRAFSSDPETAAAMVAAAVEGFHDAGVLCCLKHFPGHGDTAADTHYGCAMTDKTWEEMQACELLPFQSGIAAGADLVMAAHITAPNAASDGLPASLSAEMITGRLRGELGYTGVVITDSLAMRAITDTFTPEQSAQMAFEAGADLLLMPNGLREAFDGMVRAVESGAVSKARLEESVYRILSLKQRAGLL